jgi:hypothetical protein
MCWGKMLKFEVIIDRKVHIACYLAMFVTIEQIAILRRMLSEPEIVPQPFRVEKATSSFQSDA